MNGAKRWKYMIMTVGIKGFLTITTTNVVKLFKGIKVFCNNVIKLGLEHGLS